MRKLVKKNGKQRSRIIHGDCLEVLDTLESNSIDSLTTDPPYGIHFMNSQWDYEVPDRRYWRKALRVIKPGGHGVVFGGTKKFHRLICAIEDVGWEIRDCLMWLYGEGFPKSHDISKAIDDLKGVKRKKIAKKYRKNDRDAISMKVGRKEDYYYYITRPESIEAIRWEGWGTALSPAWEPIILIRKPFKGTLAQNVLRYGTGGLNIDACRIGIEKLETIKSGSNRIYNNHISVTPERIGRWPSNLILDDDIILMLDHQSGISKSTGYVRNNRSGGDNIKFISKCDSKGYSDEGGASRFFYVHKASRNEREHGMGSVEEIGHWSDGRKKSIDNAYQRGKTKRKNIHPTVKPVELMVYLIKLITPPGGSTIDLFVGSGTTVEAAISAGFSGVGIDITKEYVDIARRRMNYAIADYQLKKMTV